MFNKVQMMKRVIIAILFLFGLMTVPAMAQCTGIFGANQVCGSIGGGNPGQVPFSTVIEAVPWANITGTPTTIAGYGITNARTQLAGNVTYWVNGNAASTNATTSAGNATLHFASGSGTTNATTSAGNATLHFAATPGSIYVGATITDTTSAVIPAGTTVSSVTPTTVVISANATGGGVGNGDTIAFSYTAFQVGQTITDNTAAVIPAATTITAVAYNTVTLSANVTGGGVGNGDTIAASAPCGSTGASTCSPGSDSNNGTAIATPFLTLQHAVSLVLDAIDLSGFNVTINLAHAASNKYASICEGGPVLGQSVFGIQGDSTNINAVTMVATTSVMGIKDGCTVSISNVAMADNASSNASALIATGTGAPGHVDLSNISLGALGIGTALSASYAGTITVIGTNYQTGSENALASAGGTGVIDIVGTIAGSAGITWGTAAAVEQNNGAIIDVTPSTFTGYSGVSGPRCYISTSATPDGYNPNALFPGGTDCVINGPVHGAIALQTGSGASSSLAYGSAGQPLLSGGGSGAKDTWGGAMNTTSLALGGATIGGNALAVTGTTLFNNSVSLANNVSYFMQNSGGSNDGALKEGSGGSVFFLMGAANTFFVTDNSQNPILGVNGSGVGGQVMTVAGASTLATTYVNVASTLAATGTNAGSAALAVQGGLGVVGGEIVHGEIVGGTSSLSGIALSLQNTAGTCTLTPTASTAVFSCSSDARLKSAPQDDADELAYLDSFRVRNYAILSTGEVVTGAIAQEVAETHPEMVHTGADGMLRLDGIDPWKMVRAIQELKAANDNLRAEIRRIGRR